MGLDAGRCDAATVLLHLGSGIQTYFCFTLLHFCCSSEGCSSLTVIPVLSGYIQLVTRKISFSISVKLVSSDVSINVMLFLKGCRYISPLPLTQF